MRFKEFMLTQENQGFFGKIATSPSPVGFIKQHIKSFQPVKGKGSTIGRMLSAGKVKNPASAPKLNFPRS